MLASYISAVLYTLIVSFIDLLSQTVQCRSCSVGKALHLGTCPGTHLHVRAENTTWITVSGSCENRGGVLGCRRTVPRCIGGATKETLCTGTTSYPGNRGADGSSLVQLGSYVRAADTLTGYSTEVAS